MDFVDARHLLRTFRRRLPWTLEVAMKKDFGEIRCKFCQTWQRSEVQHYDEESFLAIAPGTEGQECINPWCRQWIPADNDNFRWRTVKPVELKKP